MASGLRPRRGNRRHTLPPPMEESVEEEEEEETNVSYDTASLLPTARQSPLRTRRNAPPPPAATTTSPRRPPPPPPPPLFHTASPEQQQQHHPLVTRTGSRTPMVASVETRTTGTSPGAPPQLPPLGPTATEAATATTMTTQPETPKPEAKRWVLVIHNPSPRFQSPKIPIVVTPDMTALRLQQCVQQAIREDIDTAFDVVGLFRVSDGCFLSLEHILNAPEESSLSTWLIHRPLRPPPRPKRPFWTMEMILFASMSLLVALWYANDMLWQTVWETGGHMLEAAVNLPLREFYRHGPPFLGCWEGATLPTICARITYHGDEHFWRSNMEECRRIFTAKEEATLRFIRPMLYLLLVVGGFYAIRSLVREHALTRRTPMNRDMMETYQAFNLLLRQMKRALQHQPR